MPESHDLLREESLRKSIQNFVAHYHSERNHQRLGNQLISPEAGHLGSAGEIQRRQRLGGIVELLLPCRCLSDQVVGQSPLLVPAARVRQFASQCRREERARTQAPSTPDAPGTI
jgi:hypothetical protein